MNQSMPSSTCATDARADALGAAPLHIAFVTPEFITEKENEGGLGNYLHRMSRTLCEMNHHVEMFVTSQHPPETFDFDGVTVHRIAADAGRGLPGRLVRRVAGWRGVRRLGLDRIGDMLAGAKALASALRRRAETQHFDFVQSADFMASGLFLRRAGVRPHLARCSSASELVSAVDGDRSLFARWHDRLRRATLRKADLCYAPSRYVAEHYQQRFGLDMAVLRPPAMLEAEPAAQPPCPLPPRFLVHFGLLRSYKGTGVLADALPLVWQQEPDFRMIWAGRGRGRELEGWFASWREHRDKVLYAGQLSRPDLYAVVRRAEASVLPSLVNNLPNSVIESLLLGVPVIGSRGASIDELVEDGRSGLLVPVGDAQALAAALVRAWRRQVPWVERGMECPAVLAEMTPVVAAEGLLRLAARAKGQGILR